MDKTVNLHHEINIKIFFSLDKNCPGGILAMSPGGKIQILQIPSLIINIRLAKGKVSKNMKNILSLFIVLVINVIIKQIV